ncbi:hypothetical protein XFF7767_850023 [Xanthomonas citri pv. fuscans]|nr:hypothetical protein XFF7767_850023 [Xanthomonas citri pv. fuscans]
MTAPAAFWQVQRDRTAPSSSFLVSNGRRPTGKAGPRLKRGLCRAGLNILNILLTPGGCGTFRAGVTRYRAGVTRHRAGVARFRCFKHRFS